MGGQNATVTRVRVRVHRSTRSYNHDEIEYDAEVSEGADPDAVVADLQRRGDELIARRWREKDEAERAEAEVEAERRRAERAAREAERRARRDERATKMLAAHAADAVEGPCLNCPERYVMGCDGCPAEGQRGTQDDSEDDDIPFDGDEEA